MNFNKTTGKKKKPKTDSGAVWHGDVKTKEVGVGERWRREGGARKGVCVSAELQKKQTREEE